MTSRLVLVALLLVSLPALADDANVFQSVTAEFRLMKPADWQWVTAEQNRENLGRVDLSDEEFREAMLQYSTAPLVAIAKHPEPFDDLNPSFKVNIKPLGALKGSSGTEILGLILPQLEAVFEEAKVVEAPRQVEVAGLPAGYARLDYSLRIPDGRSFPTASQLWIVPRGDWFFMIGAGTRQDEKTGTRAEIESILKTLSLQAPESP